MVEPLNEVMRLPASVQERVRFQPFEDLLRAIFERGMPDVKFVTRVPERMSYPLVFGERFVQQAGWDGDPRFIDSGPIRINVFTEGPNAELEAYYISEAIRVLFNQVHRERWYFKGLGGILNLSMEVEPADAKDWATATGVVQFADKPKGVSRFETVYRMTIRRPQ